jgi:hypothetical protein
MPEMWAQVPETEGASCDCSDPVREALCRNPNLRSLPPVELARALGVPVMQAQRAILEMAAQLSGRKIFDGGISFDEALSLTGKPSARQPIIMAPEAGALEDPVKVGGFTFDPFSIAVGVVLGLIGAKMLSEDDGDEEEEDEDE